MQGMQVATAPAYSPPKEVKGTAVDSVNANIEAVTNKINALANFAARISDGIIGVQPPSNEPTVSPVSQSTQDYIRDLETAFERLSMQINRLG